MRFIAFALCCGSLSCTSSPPTLQERLLGAWFDVDAGCVVYCEDNRLFMSDTTCNSPMDSFFEARTQFTSSETEYTIDLDGGIVRLSATFSGEQLMLSGEDGNSITFERVADPGICER